MAELSAGRELDALIADKVMGLTLTGPASADFIEGGWTIWGEVESGGNPEPTFLRSCNCEATREYYAKRPQRRGDLAPWEKVMANGHYASCLGVLPRYSESIAAAWEVVERIRTLHPEWDFDLTWFAEDDWQAQFGLYDGSASAPALAICLAALAAVQGTREDV